MASKRPLRTRSLPTTTTIDPFVFDDNGNGNGNVKAERDNSRDTRRPPASRVLVSLLATSSTSETPRTMSLPAGVASSNQRRRRRRRRTAEEHICGGQHHRDTEEQLAGTLDSRERSGASSLGVSSIASGSSGESTPSSQPLSREERHYRATTQARLDDLHYLLDGLVETQSIEVRETSAFSLAQMLHAESEALLVLRIQGLVPKTLQILTDACTSGLEHESLTTTALCTFYVLIRKNPDICAEFKSLTLGVLLQVYKATVVDTTRGRVNKPGRLRLVPRKENSMIERIRSFIRRVEGEHSALSKQVSAGALCLRILHALVTRVSHLREEFGRIGGAEVVQRSAEANLTHFSNSRCEDREVAMGHFTSALAILEVLTKEQVSSSMVHLLLTAAEVCNGVLEERETHPHGFVIECIQHVLRILVNFSNENETACRVITDAGGMHCILATLRHQRSGLYDVHLLALGALINLVEHSNSNRCALREITWTCHLNREQVSAVTFLVRQYKANRSKNGTLDKTATECNVLAAYFALVLGCLVRENPTNHRIVAEMLPEQSLNTLTVCLEEFMEFQRTANCLAPQTEASITEVTNGLKALDGLQ